MKEDSCIYKNLVIWMVTNRVSMKKMSTMIGVGYVTFWYWMSGATEIKISAIRKILEITGMSFEKAFAVEESEEYDGTQKVST